MANTAISISQLQIDIQEHFQKFERAPIKAAWRRRDARSCLIWIAACLPGILWVVLELPSVSLYQYIPVLFAILIITMICAAKITDVYARIRAESLGADVNASRTDRLKLRQDWLCMRYECRPGELVIKARALRQLWEERQEIRRLASNDTMGPRFAAFFRLPDSARFIGLLIAITAIIATLVTLGSSIDSIFEALQNWRRLIANVLIATLLCAEVVLFWILLTGMIREIGPSILEEIGVLPLSSRQVYRYLLAMHTASEPNDLQGKWIDRLLSFAALFFIPIPQLWERITASVSSRLSRLSA